ncbi:hypothetical protein ACFQMA_14865 [Halosimplex aquaticum]|uniref:Uncharacterized protein n=1 Tax=Halosimplex aquaticum TaxID=3026162 RepID=A0ABD5Y5E4_9EURY|nr:hypothetical protein [Halosimplex aquaticum]
MERGTDWERAAVRERWAEVARRERAARRLRTGAVLLLGGLVVTLTAVPGEACVEQGAWPHGCTAVVPAATRALLLAVGPAAVLAGLWVCWRTLSE